MGASGFGSQSRLGLFQMRVAIATDGAIACLVAHTRSRLTFLNISDTASSTDFALAISGDS